MKDKKKIIIPVVVAVIVIIAVVIIGITTLKKKAETTKIDIDTKSYVADLSKYIEKIDDTKDVEETKESISSEIVTLQKKYPNSESVSISSVELLNTLSSSKAQSTKGLKDTLQGALAKVGQTVDKLIYKSKVEPNVVTIASSTVCEKYGSSSKYCLDGTSKKLNAYIYVNDELKLIQSGNAVASYSTIELNQFIPLKIGDDFEVVFKITVEGNAGVPISEIISLNNLFYGENISYISYDGENWNDLFNLTWTYHNHSYKSQVACIKAFTVLNKINSTVTLTINDECNPVEIIATVLNQYGNPVNSGQVIFNIEGNEYTVDIINGISKLNYIFKSSGVKLIKVSFNSDKYTGSSSNITIHSKQVSIVANDMVSCHNGTFYYSIRLIDDDSNPVANKEIKFKINDKVYVVSTDSNGIAKVSLKLAFGSYNIEIGFNDVINNEGYNLTKKITLKSSITTLANEVCLLPAASKGEILTNL